MKQGELDFAGCWHPRVLSVRAGGGPLINVYCKSCRQRLRTGLPHWRGHDVADRYNRMKKAREAS